MQKNMELNHKKHIAKIWIKCQMKIDEDKFVKKYKVSLRREWNFIDIHCINMFT